MGESVDLYKSDDDEDEEVAAERLEPDWRNSRRKGTPELENQNEKGSVSSTNTGEQSRAEKGSKTSSVRFVMEASLRSSQNKSKESEEIDGNGHATIASAEVSGDVYDSSEDGNSIELEKSFAVLARMRRRGSEEESCSTPLALPGAYLMHSQAVSVESSDSDNAALEDEVESIPPEPVRSSRDLPRSGAGPTRSRRSLAYMFGGVRSRRALGYLQTQSKRFWNRSALQAELVVPPVHAEVRVDDTRMRRSKIFVYLLILFVSLAVGVAAFFRQKDIENDEFESEFEDIATTILSAADGKVGLVKEVMKSFGVSLTAHVLSSNSTWPFVTFPYFEARAQAALETSGAELLAFLPLVLRAYERTWALYANANQGWMTEGLLYQNETSVDAGEIPESIYTTDAIVDGSDSPVKVPLWQVSPVPSNARVIMRDMLANDWFRQAATIAMQSTHGVVSRVVDAADILQLSHLSSEDGQPRSVLLQPVFDRLGQSEPKQIVGFIVAVLGWESCFVDVVQDYRAHVNTRVDDGCGTALDFSVEGPEVYFAADGDGLEEGTLYDSLRLVTQLAGFAQIDGGEACNYMISVVPTAEFEDMHTTNKPLVFLFYVICACVFTASVFACYDCAVQKDHRKLMRAFRRAPEHELASSRYIVDSKHEPASSRYVTDRIQETKSEEE